MSHTGRKNEPNIRCRILELFELPANADDEIEPAKLKLELHAGQAAELERQLLELPAAAISDSTVSTNCSSFMLT